LSLFVSLRRRPPTSTLFPSTTLFRSHGRALHPRLADHRSASERHRASARQSAPPGRHWLHRGGGGVRCRHDPRRRPSDRSDGLRDRKSTRLNSSHVKISYAVFCLKKK